MHRSCGANSNHRECLLYRSKPAICCPVWCELLQYDLNSIQRMLLESQKSLIPKNFSHFWAFGGLLGILGPAMVVAVSPPLDGPGFTFTTMSARIGCLDIEVADNFCVCLFLPFPFCFVSETMLSV